MNKIIVVFVLICLGFTQGGYALQVGSERENFQKLQETYCQSVENPSKIEKCSWYESVWEAISSFPIRLYNYILGLGFKSSNEVQKEFTDKIAILTQGKELLNGSIIFFNSRKMPIVFSLIKAVSLSSYNHVGIYYYDKDLDKAFIIEMEYVTYEKEGKEIDAYGLVATPIENLAYKFGAEKTQIDILLPSVGNNPYIASEKAQLIGQQVIDILKKNYKMVVHKKDKSISFENKLKYDIPKLLNARYLSSDEVCSTYVERVYREAGTPLPNLKFMVGTTTPGAIALVRHYDYGMWINSQKELSLVQDSITNKQMLPEYLTSQPNYETVCKDSFSPMISWLKYIPPLAALIIGLIKIYDHSLVYIINVATFIPTNIIALPFAGLYYLLRDGFGWVH